MQLTTCPTRKLQKSDKICNPFHTQPTTEPQVNKYMEDLINTPHPPPRVLSLFQIILNMGSVAMDPVQNNKQIQPQRVV